MKVKKKKNTIDDLAVTVKDLAVNVGGLTTIVKKLSTKVDNLSTTVDRLSIKVDDLSTTVDNLAMMTKRGFDDADRKTDTLNKKIDILAENNAREHEDLRLRLDYGVYRFELVDLQKRVEILEEKAE